MSFSACMEMARGLAEVGIQQNVPSLEPPGVDEEIEGMLYMSMRDADTSVVPVVPPC